MLSTAAIILGAATMALAQSPTWPAGVQGTGTMGKTNPTNPVTNTPVNQTSESRLLTLNSVDDFCIFAPPYEITIAESEPFVVSWCTKPRNNARVIPDGVLTGVSFIKTDHYVQIMGYGDLTKLNIPAGDWGGELDPHGAYGHGNPEGGNVTTTVTPSGAELNVAEWMQFISYQQFCIRACTHANGSYSAAAMCEHKLDVMGCNFVMPGNYNFNNTFESCEADVAYPPGWYPTATVDGEVKFSTFAQYYTGIYTANGTPVSYTVGTTVTPSSAAFTPASRNCQTTSSISNGLNLLASGAAGSSGAGTTPTAGASAGASGSKGTNGGGASQTAGTSGGSASGAPTGAAGSMRQILPGFGALAGLTIASVLAVASGAVLML